MSGGPQGRVTAVSCHDTYAFTKPPRGEIVLVAGVGVAGDVHAGVYVKHRGRVRADPAQPNLRQVHLIQRELFAEVGAKGYTVTAGNLGENVTTAGLDLLALPLGTVLRLGPPPDRNSSPRGSRDGCPVPTHDAGPGGAGPLSAVLAAAALATLDQATAASVSAVAAVARRGSGLDPRPAVILTGLRNPCQQINRFRPGLLKEVLDRDGDGNLVRRAGVMAVVLRGGPVRPGDAVTVELPLPPHVALDRV